MFEECGLEFQDSGKIVRICTWCFPGGTFDCEGAVENGTFEESCESTENPENPVKSPPKSPFFNTSTFASSTLQPMKNVLMSLAVVALVSALPVRASQEPKSAQNQMAARTAAHQEALKKIEFLVGTWKGKALYWTGPDQKHEVEQTETVQFKQQGLLIQVEGAGRDAKTGILVHDALGIISFDDTKNTYRLVSWAGAGRTGEFEVSVGPNRLEWGMKNAGFMVRYITVLNEQGEWFETGERSADGVTWTKFVEMTLRKVS